LDVNIVKVKVKSVAPVYGIAVIWVLYVLIFPLYLTWHFIIPACLSVLTYFILSKIFPGSVKKIEVPIEPISTGDDAIDSLLAQGNLAISEMKRLHDSILDGNVCKKIIELISISEKIFDKLRAQPDVYRQVKRFTDFFLPASLKLLNTYDRIGNSGVEGENISGTMERIENALDMTLESYKKFFDSLFENVALDIETDITVLESMLKNDGLLEREF